jgi:hypothetical protein
MTCAGNLHHEAAFARHENVDACLHGSGHAGRRRALFCGQRARSPSGIEIAFVGPRARARLFVFQKGSIIMCHPAVMLGFQVASTIAGGLAQSAEYNHQARIAQMQDGAAHSQPTSEGDSHV